MCFIAIIFRTPRADHAAVRFKGILGLYLKEEAFILVYLTVDRRLIFNTIIKLFFNFEFLFKSTVLM